MGQQSTLVRKGEIPTPPHIRDISPSIATQNYHRLVAKLWGGRCRTFKLYFLLLSRYLAYKVLKIGISPVFCRFSRFLLRPPGNEHVPLQAGCHTLLGDKGNHWGHIGEEISLLH